MELDIGQTHIRLKTDLEGHDLYDYIVSIRADLNSYIARNGDFLHAFAPVEINDDASPIVRMMHKSSLISGVGPMACVAGTVSEISLNYLMSLGSRDSIVENGGDIALINKKSVLCGIYSGNEILGDNIAFKIPPRSSPVGICTSSGKIGHSISFGEAQSVTVIADSASVADGLATRIANGAKGGDDEERVTSAAETAENLREFFRGVLIISGENVATVGRLAKIVETNKFDVNQM